MPVTVAHAKSVTVTDATSTNIVRPSDWNSNHNVTFTPAASEIQALFAAGRGLTKTTDANGITYGAYNDLGFYEPFILLNTATTLSSPGIGTWYFDPCILKGVMEKGRINNLVSNAAGFLCGAVFSAASTGSASRVQTFYNQAAIYSQGTGANTTRLESVWTGAMSMLFTQSVTVSSTATAAIRISNYLSASIPAQWDTAGGVTYTQVTASGTVAVAASTAASTVANSLITAAVAYLSGGRMDIMGFTTTLPAGNYWMANMFTSTSSSAGTRYGAGTLISTHSRLGIVDFNAAPYMQLGKSLSNSTSNEVPFDGFVATVSSNAFSTVGTSDFRNTTGRVYWNYFQDALS